MEESDHFVQLCLAGSSGFALKLCHLTGEDSAKAGGQGRIGHAAFNRLGHRRQSRHHRLAIPQRWIVPQASQLGTGDTQRLGTGIDGLCSGYTE